MRWTFWRRRAAPCNGHAAAEARREAARKLRETRRITRLARPQVDRLAAEIDRALQGRA